MAIQRRRLYSPQRRSLCSPQRRRLCSHQRRRLYCLTGVMAARGLLANPALFSNNCNQVPLTCVVDYLKLALELGMFLCSLYLPNDVVDIYQKYIGAFDVCWFLFNTCRFFNCTFVSHIISI